MKIIYIGGEPATGKTTLMRAILSNLSPRGPFTFGKVKGTVYADNLHVVGIYDDTKPFAGTDRLSMTVITDAIKYLEHFKDTDTTILMEGDRLFNKVFLDACKANGELKIFVLQASSEKKHERHITRGDTQSETWLKSRATKVQNIVNQFPEAILLENSSLENLSKNFSTVYTELKK